MALANIIPQAFYWYMHQSVKAKKLNNLNKALPGSMCGGSDLPAAGHRWSVLPSVSILFFIAFLPLVVPSVSLCLTVIWPNKNSACISKGDSRRWFFSLTARTQWVLDTQAKFLTLRLAVLDENRAGLCTHICHPCALLSLQPLCFENWVIMGLMSSLCHWALRFWLHLFH